MDRFPAARNAIPRCGTAPATVVKHLERDAGRDLDHLRGVLRRIAVGHASPVGAGAGRPSMCDRTRTGEQQEEAHTDAPRPDAPETSGERFHARVRRHAEPAIVSAQAFPSPAHATPACGPVKPARLASGSLAPRRRKSPPVADQRMERERREATVSIRDLAA